MQCFRGIDKGRGNKTEHTVKDESKEEGSGPDCLFVPGDRSGPHTLTNTSRNNTSRLKFCLTKEAETFCANIESCEQIPLLFTASKVILQHVALAQNTICHTR